MNQPALLPSRDKIQWLQPAEIVENPRFLVKIAMEESFSRRVEVSAGQCEGSFLAVVASLTAYPEKFARIVKGHRIRDGRFCFNFYTAPNTMKCVKIDNRLPTVDKKLIYAQAPADIFWCAFLEKAYASFLENEGGYVRVQDAAPDEIIFHLTGLKSIYSPVKRASPEGIFLKLSEAMTQESVIVIITPSNRSSAVTGIRKWYSLPVATKPPILKVSIRANLVVNGNSEERWIEFEEFQRSFQHLYISRPEKRV